MDLRSPAVLLATSRIVLALGVVMRDSVFIDHVVAADLLHRYTGLVNNWIHLGSRPASDLLGTSRKIDSAWHRRHRTHDAKHYCHPECFPRAGAIRSGVRRWKTSIVGSAG